MEKTQKTLRMTIIAGLVTSHILTNEKFCYMFST